MRDKQLHVLLSEEEKGMLRQVSEREGLTPSDTVRQFIRRAYDRLFKPHG